MSFSDRKRAMITLGDPTTYEDANGETHTPYNIVKNHAYSVINTVTVRGTNLIQVRNPWGREQYDGPWSTNDTKNWTEANKKAAGYDEFYENEGNDGVFFMPVKEFKESFGMFWINYDVHDMYRDGWLKIGDTTNSPGDPDNKKCGEKCTSHSFTLTS